MWSLCDREVASTNFKSCVFRAVSSSSSHHPQKVLLVQLSLYSTAIPKLNTPSTRGVPCRLNVHRVTPWYNPAKRVKNKYNLWHFIWVEQTNKMMTRNCLTRGNLWGNATGYFSAMDLTQDVVITPE